MGCCHSCFSRDDNASKTNERSHLLRTGGDDSSYSESLNTRMSYPRYDAIREQESLQKIVQKTAENLIDISNSHVNERLLQQQQQLLQHLQLDTTERANEYKALISTIKLNSKTFPKIQEGLTISKSKKRQTLSHLIEHQQQQLQDYKEESQKEQVKDESTKSLQSSESSSSSDLILSEGIITDEDEELLSKAMDDINQALKQIKVEYVGDLVVPLTWANSAPINSNSTQG